MSVVCNVLVTVGFLAGAGAISSGLVSSAFAGAPTTTVQPEPKSIPALSITGLAALASAIGGAAAYAEIKRRGQEPVELEDDDE